MPTSESHGEPLDSLEAWIPVHRGFRRDANVMVSIPVLKEPRLKESVVTILPVERRLLKFGQGDSPWFVEQPG